MSTDQYAGVNHYGWQDEDGDRAVISAEREDLLDAVAMLVVNDNHCVYLTRDQANDLIVWLGDLLD